jgi:methionyl-tRNA formyltransferase
LSFPCVFNGNPEIKTVAERQSIASPEGAKEIPFQQNDFIIMRITYFGSADFGIPCLSAIKRSGHDLVHIFTQPAHKAGRGRKPRPTAVAQWAAENDIPCTEAENINESDMVKQVESCHSDLLVVIAFGQKIGQPLIKWHRNGAINVHASILPKYRGAAPINWALMNNETESGVSIITLAERMDAGDVLGIGRLQVHPEDTTETLYDRLAHMAPLELLEVIGQIDAGTAVYTKQDDSLATLAPKMKKSDGWLDFSKSAQEIQNTIRAFWSWPGAQADYYSVGTKKCYRTTIASAEVVETDDNPGTHGLLDEDLNVICGKDRLKIIKIKPAGSHIMDFQDFVNGRQSKPGDLFMQIENKNV